MKVKKELTNTEIIGANAIVSNVIFGAAVDNFELVVRQYLLMRLAGLELNEALLHSVGSSNSAVIYPLPSVWRSVIRKNGFSVAETRSALLWGAAIGKLLLYGVFEIASHIICGVKGFGYKHEIPNSSYAYFSSLASENLPQPCLDGRSHDIMTWYVHWRGSESKVDVLKHSIPGAAPRSVAGKLIEYSAGPVPPMNDGTALLRFCGWATRALGLCILDLASGRWWHAIMLKEAAAAAITRLHNPQKLAREYLFHNSGWIYRPLWTYEAALKGSKIIFYFYSTNAEGFKRPGGLSPLTYGYDAMSWPHYLVWDEHQAEFVRCAVGNNVPINVVGQIWFQTSDEEMPVMGNRTLSVFDVSPCRPSFYARLAMETDFYVPEVSIRFLTDILKAAYLNGYDVVWKRKRRDTAIIHQRYRKLSDSLVQSDSVIIVDPEVSANRVIEQSRIVISMPFTSTALIARELGRPSCYYDPIGILDRNDSAAHGIPIVQGIEALKMWVSSNAVVGNEVLSRPEAAQIRR